MVHHQKVTRHLYDALIVILCRVASRFEQIDLVLHLGSCRHGGHGMNIGENTLAKMQGYRSLDLADSLCYRLGTADQTLSCNVSCGCVDSLRADKGTNAHAREHVVANGLDFAIHHADVDFDRKGTVLEERGFTSIM